MSPPFQRALFAALAVTIPLSGGCRMGGDAAARLITAPAEIDFGHGRMVPLRMSWEPLEQLEGEEGGLAAFVHLLDRSGDLVRTFNHPLPGGSLTEALEETVPLYHSLLGPALPAGEYTLTAGLVDGAGRRFALAAAGKEVVRREYSIARVRVPAGPAPATAVRFSDEWSDPILGTDHQVRTSRNLATRGTLEAQAPGATASLGLSLRIQEVGDASRCALAGGASRPEVRVASSCSGFEVSLAGVGLHQAEAPLPAGATGCVLEVEPNFSCQDAGHAGRFTLTLEQLGWVLAPNAR